MESLSRRFKWSWIGAVVGSGGVASASVVYRQTTATLLGFGAMVGAVLVIGGVVLGMRLDRWNAIPSAAGIGALALGLSVTVVGAFQATPSGCGGDCEQGGGLGLLAAVGVSFVAFLVTMSCGMLISRLRARDTGTVLRTKG